MKYSLSFTGIGFLLGSQCNLEQTLHSHNKIPINIHSLSFVGTHSLQLYLIPMFRKFLTSCNHRE